MPFPQIFEKVISNRQCHGVPLTTIANAVGMDLKRFKALRKSKKNMDTVEIQRISDYCKLYGFDDSECMGALAAKPIDPFRGVEIFNMSSCDRDCDIENGGDGEYVRVKDIRQVLKERTIELNKAVSLLNNARDFIGSESLKETITTFMRSV